MKLLLFGDLHLTSTAPRMRIDNYIATQRRKLEFIANCATKHKVDLIVSAGDLFDEPKPEPIIINMVLDTICEFDFYVCPGNHDLPYSSVNFLDNSALSILSRNKHVILGTKEVFTHHSGVKLASIPYSKKWHNQEFPNVDVLVIHRLVFHRNIPFWATNCLEKSFLAEELLQCFFKKAKIILCGHNHEKFSVENGNSILINAGSVLRTSITQRDHKPAIYLYVDGKIQEIPIPIEKDVWRIEMSNNNNKEMINSEITRVLEDMLQKIDAQFSFYQIFEQYAKDNNLSDDIKNKIIETFEKVRDERRKIENES